MIRFIDKPNLPKGKVRTIICGEYCDELNVCLDSLGIERLVIKPNNHIDPAVKYHADMAAIHLGDDKVLLDKQQVDLGENLKSRGFDICYTEREVTGEYPSDISLNFVVMSEYFIGKLECADESLSAYIDRFKSINVKQGYCKCSCLVIDENAVITDDISIYNALASNNIDVLCVSKGDILLPGHEYGFIGGASGKISKNEILFFGDVTKHRDYKKIADFIKKHGCEIVSLDFTLTDFGGMIPLEEKV